MAAFAERPASSCWHRHNRDLIEKTCNKVLALEHGTVRAFQVSNEWFERAGMPSGPARGR